MKVKKKVFHLMMFATSSSAAAAAAANSLKTVNKAMLARRMKHTLPDLPYDYNSLEPYVSADIMKLASSTFTM